MVEAKRVERVGTPVNIAHTIGFCIAHDIALGLGLGLMFGNWYPGN